MYINWFIDCSCLPTCHLQSTITQNPEWWNNVSVIDTNCRADTSTLHNILFVASNGMSNFWDFVVDVSQCPNMHQCSQSIQEMSKSEMKMNELVLTRTWNNSNNSNDLSHHKHKINMLIVFFPFAIDAYCWYNCSFAINSLLVHWVIWYSYRFQCAVYFIYPLFQWIWVCECVCVP